MSKKNNRMKVMFALMIIGSIWAAANLLTVTQVTPEKVKVVLPEMIEPNPYVEKLLTDYENDLRKQMANTQTPGVAVAVIHDTTTIYLKGFGLRQVGTTDSVDIHSVFRLASVSKCFAPLLTGILVDEGVLSWDDKIIKYLPDFRFKKKEYSDQLTIRHVLSHTTGLPYHTYTNMVEEGMELKAMLDLLKEVNPASRPGEVYSYQNVAYSLIAEVIKAATGKSYEQLMMERIFKPLGMSDASMSYNDILLNNNVARPHLLWRKGWRVTSINNTYYNVAPAGGINASISDMAQWLKVMVGDTRSIVTKQTRDEIFRPTIKARSKNRNFRRWIEPADSYYALGWRVLNFKNDTLLYHGGYVNGYRSEVAINPKNKIAICVLSNGPGYLVDNSVPIFFKLYFEQRDSIALWAQNRKLPREASPAASF
jgi:beta-lactamase class C